MKGTLAAMTIVGLWAVAAAHPTARPQQTAAASQAPGGVGSPAQASRSVWDGVYTEEQANRGAAVYRRECARCHGPALEGGGEGAGALTGVGFIANWNGLTLGDLVDRMRVSMPQDAPGKLTRQQAADVVAHILSVNKFPVGKTELARASERLKQVRFDAIRKEAWPHGRD